jgi:hypothetical protein
VTALRVTARPPRCYVAGLRVHHAVTGCALIVGGLRLHRLGMFVFGVLLVVHDWPDWPFSLFDGH